MVKINIVKKLLYIVALVTFLVFNISIPIRIEAESIEIQATNLDVFEHRTVQISGWYRFNLFSDDRFRGQITVTGHDLTYNEMLDVRFRSHLGVFRGVMAYSKINENENNRIQTHLFGVIESGLLFRNAIIVLFEYNVMEDGTRASSRSSSISTSPVIILNVNTYEEAKKRLKSMNVQF